MFGVVVAGRLVQTDYEQVTQNQFLFNIVDADSINHVVVFLTGQTPFPDGYGGAVYFAWPSAQGQNWILLGHITNIKPSAIFKVSKLKSSDSSMNPFQAMTNQPVHVAQIGISVDPLTELSQQTPATSAAVSNLEPFVDFSKKMVENLFNFVTSFSSPLPPVPTETYIPSSVLQKWYDSFIRKMQQDPYFWRS
ncbi:HIKESHI [Acanthosepion pharaonis]|uniref:HIKESHI n=1 Tax=Acanthosepion pharaonis TaxID=158019 RepID=A0A812EHA0_ACAPH|nr:HIKESHI [Sepia pharaonis]